jgi:hypothetical protein
MKGKSYNKILQNIYSIVRDSEYDETHKNTFNCPESGIEKVSRTVVARVIEKALRNENFTYKMSDRFLTDLLKTKAPISVKGLREMEGNVYCIEFDRLFREGDTVFTGAMCRLENHILGVTANTLNRDLKANFGFAAAYFNLREHEHRTVDGMLETLPVYTGDRLPDEILKVLIKSPLYIGSSQPDLQPPSFVKGKGKKKNRISPSLLGLSPIPHQVVGYSFHGKKYITSGGMRIGHFRWQPHGPENSLRKLIWINETEWKRQAMELVNTKNEGTDGLETRQA